MPTDNFGNAYSHKGSGTNSQGDHWCSRDFGESASNQNSYHYSNSDGSYYYSNSDGSTYYNDGKGGSTYTAPSEGTGNNTTDSNSGEKK